MIHTRNKLPHLGDRLFVLRCRPHPQLGTVTGDTSVCVKWNCGILAMLDYYTGAAKCQGGTFVLSKTGYMGRFHNGVNKQL